MAHRRSNIFYERDIDAWLTYRNLGLFKPHTMAVGPWLEVRYVLTYVALTGVGFIIIYLALSTPPS